MVQKIYCYDELSQNDFTVIWNGWKARLTDLRGISVSARRSGDTTTFTAPRPGIYVLRSEEDGRVTARKIRL